MIGNRSILRISLTLLFLVWLLRTPAAAQTWTVLAFDAQGDGRDASLADAAQLSYRYDAPQDLLWFRLTVYGKLNKAAFGVNIAFDTGADDAAKMNWWGENKEFKFDKLVTAWVTRSTDGYRGTIGVANAAGAMARNMNNLLQNNVEVRANGDSVILGVNRSDITDKMKMNLIAAVGSNEQWNDDIPDTRSASLDLSAPRPTRRLMELDFNRNNLRFPSGYKTLSDNQPPLVEKRGNGHQALVLVPGVYSGKEVFDSFVKRNESQYKFYIVTPPGLNGTPARPLPLETTSCGEYKWTRQLERDLINLIHREKLNKPVVVVHGFPGSLAAVEIAKELPDILGGIVDISSIAVQFFPSPKDPTRKTPATLDQRIGLVDAGWVQKWFKYVTPETWESNNYPAEMVANDSSRAERVRQQFESAALPIKIQYLTEFMASDQTSELANLQVPLLALRPGFNDSVLTNPMNSFFKMFFLDSWEPFSHNSQITITTIPNARALILDDQPKLADDAIAAFVEKVIRPKNRS